MILDKIKEIPGRAINMVSHDSSSDATPILVKLGRSLWRESSEGLRCLANFVDDPDAIHALYIVIDQMTNNCVSVRNICRSKGPISAESALTLLVDCIRRTNDLVRSGDVSSCVDARDFAIRSLNLLFVATQELKYEFGVPAPLETSIDLANQADLKLTNFEPCAILAPPEVLFSSAMICQFRHSLFPAERMLVGAGRKTGDITTIEAVFDVTGTASAAGVKADPDRLGHALMAMSRTGTFFALWIHSHPGSGPGATHPSIIDVRQHADWLTDYSQYLVSAIMVKDQYIRFWGTAVEQNWVKVRIEGPGIEVISAVESIYQIKG